MMEQMCLDILIPEEQKAFELVYPELKSVIFDATMDSGVLIFQPSEA